MRDHCLALVEGWKISTVESGGWARHFSSNRRGFAAGFFHGCNEWTRDSHL